MEAACSAGSPVRSAQAHAALPSTVALFRKRRLDRELEDEIVAHLELAERDAIDAGMTPGFRLARPGVCGGLSTDRSTISGNGMHRRGWMVEVDGPVVEGWSHLSA